MHLFLVSSLDSLLQCNIYNTRSGNDTQTCISFQAMAAEKQHDCCIWLHKN